MLDLAKIQYYLVAPEILKTRVHHFYNRSVEITNKIEAHSKGKYPKEILDVVRPNETPQQKTYREKAWRPVTKTYFSKAVSTFGKIKKAEDWSIKFEYENNPSVLDNESLENYTTENFPNFGSIENWLWSFQFNEMFDDPNGVIAVFPYPKNDPLNESEYLRPFPFWFESEAVIDYKENEFAVLISGEKSKVYSGQTDEMTGLVYYMFDSNSYAKCIQIGQKLDYNFEIQILPIDFGYFPCFKIGGIVEEFLNGEKLWDSFMGDCIPFFDEAVARYSDLQVQNVLHVHSEKWEIEDTPCKTCTGSGQVRNSFMGGSGYSTCGTCNGSGAVSIRTPFGVKTVKPQTKTGLNDAVNIPIPPMGYINKPIEDTKFIKEQFEGNILKALAAVNLEFVMYEPGINSGIAKAYDRQEINSTLGNVAWHVVKNILEPVYFLCGMWRYYTIESEDEIAKMVPCINVPTQFDVLNEDILSARISALKTAGASASLLAELETKFAKKEFGEDSIQAEIIEATGNLDPLPNKNEADKMTILSNGGTTKYNYILSSNLTAFLNRAYSENEEFFDLTREEQLAIIDPYVQEIITEQNKAKVPQIVRIPTSEYKPNANDGLKSPSGSIDAALEKTENGISLPTKK